MVHSCRLKMLRAAVGVRAAAVGVRAVRGVGAVRGDHTHSPTVFTSTNVEDEELELHRPFLEKNSDVKDSSEMTQEECGKVVISQIGYIFLRTAEASAKIEMLVNHRKNDLELIKIGDEIKKILEKQSNTITFLESMMTSKTSGEKTTFERMFGMKI